ncbi:hypothetical protein CEUSTIGMA_g7910.t1 [Chlamydomonas eustigma]|uniref:DEP domain-containing protein n=1 Tax=Chlamydomonas eustigma TaxID=1157962 RepID=A0A250XBK7_9CHLO|nr:hypothetical protein CEUSTIGMA_g7910.t1 [Chlamydomonas eustigma]|eukprot:GAX80471.1 hypothetical protein CEUSTIGMA_g7910.t1 [Chlamydomonas eustigma]
MSTSRHAKADIKTARVVVISTPACPYCFAAKNGLRSKGIEFDEIDVSQEDQVPLRALVQEITGRKTVPQIFIKGSSIGGSYDLARMLEDGSFQTLLATEPADTPALPARLMEEAVASKDRNEKKAQEAAKRETERSGLVNICAAMSDSTSGLERVQRDSRGVKVPAFTGRQLVNWLMKEQESVNNGEEAAALARAFIENNLISALYEPGSHERGPSSSLIDSDNEWFMLVSEAPTPKPGQALNTHYWWSRTKTRHANQVAAELRQLILELYSKHLSPDGRSVDYKHMGEDPLFRKYVNATAELQQVDIEPLSSIELTALFINLYNALIIHALVVLGADMLSNASTRSRFFTYAQYCIGGNEYTADDMENGVLRGNRPAASNIWSVLGLPQFSKGQFPDKADPRRAKVVDVLDPRIHFALVCGAKSCPPIKLYTADNLDEGLNAAGEAFCGSEIEVDKVQRVVRMSKIFKWYASDFGANQTERLRWLLPFLKGRAYEELEELLKGRHTIKIVYKEYDWNVNSS